MRSILQLVSICSLFITHASLFAQTASSRQQFYNDTTFFQKYSVRYIFQGQATNGDGGKIRLLSAGCDRNGAVQIFSSAGILRPSGGQLLHPGSLVHDVSYLPLVDRKITNGLVYDQQFVYLDDKAVFSNAWAGKLYLKHTLRRASLFCGGLHSSFLISDGNELQYVTASGVGWQAHSKDRVLEIQFDKAGNVFWILTENSILVFAPATNTLNTKFEGTNLTSFALPATKRELMVGTRIGFFRLDQTTGKTLGAIDTELPCPEITVVRIINGETWFGSTRGAFKLRKDGKFDYYASQRWIPSDTIRDIAAGSDGEILLLTDKGLGRIFFQKMNLQDKATFFEKQVRSRHMRNGFNATLSRMKNGDPDTGTLEDSDNDGLWTAMYLGGQVFRYAVTRSREALENCRESLEAMERLYTINPVKGFPARSFERSGYATADKQAWRNSTDTGWEWKSTTSSDEAIGHMFTFATIAELVDDKALRSKAIRLMDTLMQHIVEHNLYLVDWDGQPTRWGRWNPEYVNARPEMVGDRKLASSNIIAMLQTAWHFTHKKVYKDKAFELMNRHGYLDNLMRPMKDISRAPESADALSQSLSDGWNHSDDEMYFLGYWGLYRYALNDTLKAKFRAAIIDHWRAERPEREAAWNIATAMTGLKNFDLDESIAYLQQYPIDLVNWKITNSHRKDIEWVAPNFRNQTIKEVLPADELPVTRHNANRFQLDGGNGQSEYSAGDIWLLPYWMARYLGVIGGPAGSQKFKK